MDVRFISIGGDFFTQQLSAETIQELLKGDYWPIRKVYELFPKRAGSRAKKHTLIFRPSNWTLQPLEKNQLNFDGFWLDLSTGHIHQAVGQPDYRLTLLDGVMIGVTTEPRNAIWDWDNLKSLAPDPDVAERLLALYKSLIQKLIRTGVEFMTHENERYLARDLLFVGFIGLALHPGAFVPTIQRYVSGLEGATKRLAVSIMEDSYYTDPSLISSLLGAALITQTDRTWRPPNSLISWWLRAAEISRQERRHFLTQPSMTAPALSTKPYTFSYYLLQTLRSFSGDLELLATIATRSGDCISGKWNAVSSLPLIHIIDQHTYPEIAWYITNLKSSYTSLFKQIWQEVSSYNPRLNELKESTFIRTVREAQSLVWLRQSSTKELLPITGEHVRYRTELPESRFSRNNHGG